MPGSIYLFATTSPGECRFPRSCVIPEHGRISRCEPEWDAVRGLCQAAPAQAVSP